MTPEPGQPSGAEAARFWAATRPGGSSVFGGPPGTTVRRSLALALAVGGIVAAFRLVINFGNDIQWPLCHARQLLAGADPYDAVCDFYPFLHHAFYPLMAGLVVLPFAAVFKSNTAVTAAILVLSYGLLTWALTRNRRLGCLVVLLSLPSLNTLTMGNWPALMLAVVFIPALLPLTLIKPQIGLPTAAYSLTRWRVLACVVFVGISVAVDPRWPAQFVQLSVGYAGYVPLLSVPGAAVAVCLLAVSGKRCLTDPDLGFFLLVGCFPQKPGDAFILAAILRTPREAVFWSACTWLCHIGRWLFPYPFFVGPHSIDFVWIEPAFLYAPAGVVLVARYFQARSKPEAAGRLAEAAVPDVIGPGPVGMIGQIS